MNLGRTSCWRRKWQPTPVLLPGKSHGWRSLVGYSPWGLEELDTTERLNFHFTSCIGEGNGTHSSILAWRIPGTEEPGGLLSMGSHRVGHDWSDLAAAAQQNLLWWWSGNQILVESWFILDQNLIWQPLWLLISVFAILRKSLGVWQKEIGLD